jgi:hypothetical protein
MRILKTLTFGLLAAFAAALLLQTPVTRANDRGHRDDDHERGDRGHRNRHATITFTKWVTEVVNQPGLIVTMAGAGDGDAGEVVYAGELLKATPAGERVALYTFTSSKPSRSFTALIHGFQPVPGIGQKGAIVGVVIDGWLKGQALEGEWTEIPPCYEAGTGLGNCFAVTLKIDKGND